MSAESVNVTLSSIEVRVKSSDEKIIVSSPRVQIVTAGRIGPSGPVGPKGDAGSPGIEVPFSFGDATPLGLAIAPAGKIIECVTIYLNVAFDGENPTLQIGDAEQLDALMSTAEVNPTEAATYQTTPGFAYEDDTEILLSIDPGLGASQGSGLVVIEMQQ